MSKNSPIYIVATDFSDYVFDENLNHISEVEDLTPIAVFRIAQTALAPAEDWDEWYLNYPLEDEMMIDSIRNVLRVWLKRNLPKLLEKVST